MKELSIEEKAKAYDEALKQIKECTPDDNGFITIYPQEIFPEPRESEDERIRKAIINEISLLEKESVIEQEKNVYQSWIGWLENQGKNNMGISEATKQKLEESLNKALEKETPESCNEFLEKQGEQPYGQRQECVDCQFNYAGECKGSCAMKRGEQKPDDKVEPKFKKGDVIRRKDGDGLEWTVEEVLNDGYYTITCDDRDDFIQLDNKWELVEQKPVIEMKTPEESLGIDSNTYNKIVDECIYGDDKPALSEEDEGYYDAIIAKLEVTQEDALLTDNEMDFLKSLKDRVQPQNRWKPSDEQMEVLRQAAYEPEKNWSEELQSLYCNLKKI